jgi:hypothetical protein
MKKFMLICFIFSGCLSLVTYSQFEYNIPDSTVNRHKERELTFSASPTLVMNTPNGTQLVGGVKLGLFLGKRFSVDADLVIGRDYVHTGLGLIGLPLYLIASASDPQMGELFSGSDESSLTTFLLSVAVVALSFEHVSYHIPLNENVEISPYVSLLRYKYAYLRSNYSDVNFISEQFSFASGLQINNYFGRFVLSPYAEYNIGYKDHISGCNIGVYCGIYFPGN